jgi:hypothetical protein
MKKEKIRKSKRKEQTRNRRREKEKIRKPLDKKFCHHRWCQTNEHKPPGRLYQDELHLASNHRSTFLKEGEREERREGKEKKEKK